MNAHNLPPRVALTIATSIVSLGLATGLPHGDGSTSNPTVWVANGLDATVPVIERVDGDTLARLPSGGNPHVLELTPDGSTMYVVNAGGHDLSDDERAAHAGRMDASPLATSSGWALDTRSWTDRCAIGNEVRDLILDHDDAVAYATNKADGTVTRIDVASGGVQMCAVGAGPHGLRLAPDGSRLYVALSGTNAVANAASIRSSGTGPGTFGVAFSNASLGAQEP